MYRFFFLLDSPEMKSILLHSKTLLCLSTNSVSILRKRNAATCEKKLSRTYDLLCHMYDLLCRTYDLVCLTYDLLSCTYDLLCHAYDLLCLTYDLLCCTYDIISIFFHTWQHYASVGIYFSNSEKYCLPVCDMRLV